jgi:DHA1 family multidrug resistance protein-like MFS transporter/DHA1 family quinolone resistance protein-like MFS transporter
VGYFTAFWSFWYIIGCILIRPLFTRTLPRYLLMASTFFMCLFILLIALCTSFWQAYAFYGLYAIAMSFFWPPIMGWLSRDAEGARLGKRMSYFNISWSAGMIIGPPLAGVLSARSTGLPLYAGSLLFFVNCILIVAGSLLLPKLRADRGTDGITQNRREEKDTSTHFRFPAWVGMFTTFVIIGVLISIFPVFAREELMLRKEIIGVLMQSRTVIATFVFILLAHTLFWHFRIVPMVMGQMCLAIVVLAMNFTSSPAVLVMLISLLGAFRSLSYSSSLFHGVSGSINRAGRMAIHESLLAAGLVFGSAIGGMLYQHYSMTAVYGFCAAVVIGGTVLQLSLYLILRNR